MRARWTVLLGGLLGGLFSMATALCLLTASALAADFYAGKSIEFIVGAAPGGGYDIYARALARHLPRFIPGSPPVVVKNMPGAGSGRAATFLYSVAPKDGTAIGALFPGAIIGPLLEDHAELHYDPTKFVYLATADNGTRVCATFNHSATKTFDDALKRKTVMGASQAGGSTRDYVNLHKKTSGALFELVTGYKGSADITLAMERGEVEGLCGWDWSSVKSQKPEWLRDGKLNLLVQASLEPDAELTRLGVPQVWSYIRKEDDRKAVELVVSQQVFQRPYVAPPGTPAAQTAILRAAFDATMQDPRFLADASKLRIDISPSHGAKVQQIVDKLYAAPPQTIARAKDIIKP